MLGILQAIPWIECSACDRLNAYKGVSSPRIGIHLAHLRISKLASVKLPSTGQIYNPSPHFNGCRFRLEEAKKVNCKRSRLREMRMIFA